MRLIAHVGADGRIRGVVATPEGKRSAMLMPAPGEQVCEIEGHDIKSETVDLADLSKLLEEHTVMVTAARGKLVRRKK